MDRHRARNPPTEPTPAGHTPSPRADANLPPQDALRPGTHIEGFEVARVIAANGFGLVYLAREESLTREVAIKEYFPDTLAVRAANGIDIELRAPAHADAFERGLRAFIDESQVLARCDHPSLVAVQRSWQAHGSAYRVMPHYAGHTLLSLRQALEVPPDEPSLRGLLDGLLGALERLHGAGVVHREIAPARILVLPDDRPVLMDFAAARRAIVGEQARALMTLLAPSFAPMEQTSPSAERPLGPWTDMYALGALLRFCITGQMPPPASLLPMPPAEPMAAVVRRMNRRYPQLHYSTALLAAIDAALIPLPDDRTRGVAEFRRRLDDHPAVMAQPFDLDDVPGEPAPPAPSPVDWPDVPAVEPTLGPPDARPQGEPSVDIPLFDAVEPERPVPAFDFAARVRRRQQRAVWAGVATVAAVVATGSWWLAQQRETGQAQATLAPVARQDGSSGGNGAPAPDPVPAAVPLPQAPTAAVTPPRRTLTRTPAAPARAATGPREACGNRTQFSLYRCMQTQCARGRWAQHPACKRLRAKDDLE